MLARLRAIYDAMPTEADNRRRYSPHDIKYGKVPLTKDDLAGYLTYAGYLLEIGRAHV